MRSRATMSNGDQYVIDHDARTITPEPPETTPSMRGLLALHAATLLTSGDLIGRQVDEFVGIRGDWDDDRAPLAALDQAAQFNRVSIVAVEPA